MKQRRCKRCAVKEVRENPGLEFRGGLCRKCERRADQQRRVKLHRSSKSKVVLDRPRNAGRRLERQGLPE